jgi:beta-N-acetylhexosaminidase
VKEEPGILPISPAKYPRVLFYDLDTGPTFFDPTTSKVFDQFIFALRNEGFAVDRFEPSKGMEGMGAPYGAVTDNYDLIIYLAKLETKSNQTVVRIEWAQPMGANCPVYIASVPTIFISLESPYHLVDVPRVKTFINAYSANAAVVESLVEKLTGRSPFVGRSPVDSFCGKWDAKL